LEEKCEFEKFVGNLYTFTVPPNINERPSCDCSRVH